MKDQKPLAERILDALKKDGPMTLEQIAEHAETTVGTLYTMMGSLKKKHGVVKIQPDLRQAATYQIGGAPAPKKPTKPAPPKRVNGSAPYAAALQGLREKRSELALELAKVDHAIEAIGALTA